ncbi:MAG: hypothetical protein MUE31_04255 [Candidatus Nanopelagicales bacterium]|nr:hypothetical protein [Candidatus Nanopelagicales bacterium]
MPEVARRTAALVAAAVMVPSLAGCWSGFGAQTSQQANQAVGNGTNLNTGDIEIRGATWVRNTANPLEATLVATFINGSDVPDKLVKVEIEPVSPMGITAGALEVPSAGSVRTGYWSPNFVNAFQVQAFPSTFVPTTFTFQNAGTVTGDVMTVPNTGQYAGVVVSLAEQAKLQKFVDKASGDTEEDTPVVEKVAKGKKKKAQEQE